MIGMLDCVGHFDEVNASELVEFVGVDTNRRNHLLAHGPVIAAPATPAFLFLKDQMVLEHPGGDFNPGKRLGDVGRSAAIGGSRQIVDVSNIGLFAIWEGQ